MAVTGIDNPALVQGMRPTRAGEYPWQYVVLKRLRHDFSFIKSSPSTEASERSLDYPPSAYWFVLRSEEAFGRIGIIWRINTPAWPSSRSSKEASVAPFDTGGLAHDYMAVAPPFQDTAEKQAFLRGEEIILDAFPQRFDEWLQAGYSGTSTDYVNGVAPAHHVARIVLDAKQNSSRAWTWELRIAVDYATDNAIEPLEIYWTESDYEEFEAWAVRHPTLSQAERVQVINHAFEISKFTNRPGQDLRARLYELV
jgi:hypothetical protein